MKSLACHGTNCIAGTAGGGLLWEIEPWHELIQGAVTQFLIAPPVRCADINGDGKSEIITGIGGITAYNHRAEQLWKAPCVGQVTDFAIGDVNGDGELEIVVASNELEVLSNSGARLFHYANIKKLGSLTIGDIDGDGHDEIMAGGYGVYLFKM